MTASLSQTTAAVKASTSEARTGRVLEESRELFADRAALSAAYRIRDRVILELHREGLSAAEIASRAALTTVRVAAILLRERQRERDGDRLEVAATALCTYALAVMRWARG